MHCLTGVDVYDIGQLFAGGELHAVLWLTCVDVYDIGLLPAG